MSGKLLIPFSRDVNSLDLTKLQCNQGFARQPCLRAAVLEEQGFNRGENQASRQRNLGRRGGGLALRSSLIISLFRGNLSILTSNDLQSLSRYSGFSMRRKCVHR